MAINPQALADEFTNDPTARGYATPVANGDVTTLLALVNEPLPSNATPVDTLPTSEVINAFDLDEYAALSAGNRAKIDFVTKTETMIVRGGAVRDILIAAFPNGTATFDAIGAIVNQDASRAFALFGENASKTDVRAALLVINSP